MSRKYFLSGVCVAFLLGVFAAYFRADQRMLMVWCLVCGGFYFGWRFFSWRWLVFLLVPFLLGFVRFCLVEGGDLDYGVENFEGCVVREVDVRDDHVKYVLDGDGGLVLVNGPRYPIYQYGDCLEIFGELRRPEAIEDFAYDKYLARYGIYGVAYRVRLNLVSDGGGFVKWLYGFKRGFEARINRVFPEPYASFVAGLLLGSRRGIDPGLMEGFNLTGLTHIIAVSGYNITIVVILVQKIFGVLGRRAKVILAAVFVFLFVLFVGASAAVVRAGIMAMISLLSIWFGRNYFVVGAFFLTAALMGAYNPLIVVYDVGFQLSFLATAAILFLVPRIERYFFWLPDRFGLRESFVITVAAQIFALPVIWLNFGRFSLVAPLVNLLVLPFVPYAMLFGFVSVAFGKAVGFLGYLVLRWIIFVVEFFAQFSWIALDGGVFLDWWAAIFYLLILEYVLDSG